MKEALHLAVAQTRPVWQAVPTVEPGLSKTLAFPSPPLPEFRLGAKKNHIAAELRKPRCHCRGIKHSEKVS